MRVLINTNVGYELTKPIHHLLVIDFLFGNMEVFTMYPSLNVE